MIPLLYVRVNSSFTDVGAVLLEALLQRVHLPLKRLLVLLQLQHAILCAMSLALKLFFEMLLSLALHTLSVGVSVRNNQRILDRFRRLHPPDERVAHHAAMMARRRLKLRHVERSPRILSDSCGRRDNVFRMKIFYQIAVQAIENI
mmetsp:Transcript_28132/g.45099  ORF Transcript_28132/g.45099 Transcript_28132/m.45099 type:complete len:146 (+) Transcript_28132:285-722(+)